LLNYEHVYLPEQQRRQTEGQTHTYRYICSTSMYKIHTTFIKPKYLGLAIYIVLKRSPYIINNTRPRPRLQDHGTKMSSHSDAETKHLARPRTKNWHKHNIIITNIIW